MRVKTLGMYSEGGGLPHLHTPISSTGVLQVRFFRKYGCKKKIVPYMFIDFEKMLSITLMQDLTLYFPPTPKKTSSIMCM